MLKMDKLLCNLGFSLGLLRVFFVRIVSSGYYMFFLWWNIFMLIVSFNLFGEQTSVQLIFFKLAVFFLFTHGIVGCIHILHDYIFDRYLLKFFNFLVWIVYFKVFVMLFVSI